LNTVDVSRKVWELEKQYRSWTLIQLIQHSS
jgi:hypothetical protein